jgi:hypothetical protein
MRILTVDMHLIGLDGRTVEMTEYTPWPERGGLWEADRHIDHDGARYEYVGCENGVYRYQEVRRSRAFRRERDVALAG